MMRIRILLLFLAFTSIASAQEGGYFGRNTFIELDLNGSLPVLQNIFEEKGYVPKNGKLTESYNLIDFGFRISLGTIDLQDRAYAFEYGYRQYQVNPLNEGELNRQYKDADGNIKEDYLNAKVGFLDIRENVFLPKIIFVNDFSHIPAGFSNEVGIGYTITTIKSATPVTEFASGTGSLSADSISKNLVDPDFDQLKGMTFMYGFKMNYPISKSLLFHIGFRYNYNLLFGKRDFRKEELSESWLSEREIWSRVNQRRQLGILSFAAGFTICF